MTSIAAVRAMPFVQKGLTHQQARNIARLFRVARDMDIEVTWRDMGHYRRGEYRDGDAGRYYDATSLIVLNPRLAGYQVATTLGHEIAHAMFGDRQSTPKIEERAQRVGAAISVDPAAFRVAREREHMSPKAMGIGRSARDLLLDAPHATGEGCPCPSCGELRREIHERLGEVEAVAEHLRCHFASRERQKVSA